MKISVFQPVYVRDETHNDNTAIEPSLSETVIIINSDTLKVIVIQLLLNTHDTYIPDLTVQLHLMLPFTAI